MIGPTGAVRVMVATKPVDFRKGAARRPDQAGLPRWDGRLPILERSAFILHLFPRQLTVLPGSYFPDVRQNAFAMAVVPPADAGQLPC